MKAMRNVLRLLGRRLPIAQGTVEVPGLTAPLRIGRDRWGVPHIYAETGRDAWFGVGFCHAQDRAFQLEIMLRVGRGTLAALVGAEGLQVDRLSRRLGLHRVATQQVQAQDEDALQLLDAYVLGVNAGLRLGARQVPHELALLRRKPSPWTVADALTTPKVLGVGGLAENWAIEHARLLISTLDGEEAMRAVEPLYPEWLTTIAGLDALRRQVGAGGGSNNWAVSGSLTASGRPLLANDPHLPPTVPGLFYLAHLKTPDWDLVGASTPGCPGITIGHNGHAAWGVTSGMADVADLCVEQLGPAGESVLQAGRLVPCEVREERIEVRGRRRPVVERVTITPRGPVVSPAGEDRTPALSMRCALLDPEAKLTGPLRMERVRSFEDVSRDASGWPFPLNVAYADEEGHIGWQLTGHVPRRVDAGWDGWLTSQELPSAADPERGFLATANNKPLPDGEGPYLGSDWMDGYRAQAICEALAARGGWSAQDMRMLQIDERSLPWRQLREHVLALTGRDERQEVLLGLHLLRQWDGRVSADSPAAAVFELLLSEMARRLVAERAPRSFAWALGRSINPIEEHTTLGLRRVSQLVCALRAEQGDGQARPFVRGASAELADALATAVRTLIRERGADEGRWAWGKLRTVTFEHPLGERAPLNRIFNLPPSPCGGDTNTIPQAAVDPLCPAGNPLFVAGLRAVFDVGDWDRSEFVLATGQSGNPLSPHYEDQNALWRRGETIVIPCSPQAVERDTVRTLHLRPAL